VLQRGRELPWRLQSLTRRRSSSGLESQQPEEPEPERRLNTTRSDCSYGVSTAAVAASSLPPEPRSYHEATSGPEGGQWDAAAQLEWDQLEQ
jgi:hypothetical protein